MTENSEKILGLLGLAAKAGALVWGAENIADAVRAGKINFRSGLVLLASDAAARTKRELLRASEDGGVPWAGSGSPMEELGRRTGAKGPAAAVAVKDKNLASALKKLI